MSRITATAAAIAALASVAVAAPAHAAFDDLNSERAESYGRITSTARLFGADATILGRHYAGRQITITASGTERRAYAVTLRDAMTGAVVLETGPMEPDARATQTYRTSRELSAWFVIRGANADLATGSSCTRTGRDGVEQPAAADGVVFEQTRVPGTDVTVAIVRCLRPTAAASAPSVTGW